MRLMLNKKASGTRIALAIKQSGFTCAQIAEKMGTSRATVRRWIKGEYTPSVDNLLYLADLTEVPVGYLLPVIRGIPNE